MKTQAIKTKLEKLSRIVETVEFAELRIKHLNETINNSFYQNFPDLIDKYAIERNNHMEAIEKLTRYFAKVNSELFDLLPIRAQNEALSTNPYTTIQSGWINPKHNKLNS